MPFLATESKKWGLDGLDVWMVIIGQRSSKSTFGANKDKLYNRELAKRCRVPI